MDAINSLVGGMRQAQTVVDRAAQEIAGDDPPTAAAPDPTNPFSPSPVSTGDADLAGQLVTMTTAADMHHITTAALRAALGMYRDSLDLVSPAHFD
jgi:hypothetical protein